MGMEFMTAEKAKELSLSNRERVLSDIDIRARNFLREQIQIRVDGGMTRFILSGQSDDVSGTPFYWHNDDQKEVVVVNVEVLQEFRALLYKVEVKCFENHVNDPPLQQWPGSMVSHLTIAWD